MNENELRHNMIKQASSNYREMDTDELLLSIYTNNQKELEETFGTIECSYSKVETDLLSDPRFPKWLVANTTGNPLCDYCKDDTEDDGTCCDSSCVSHQM